MRIHEIDLDGYEARWSESNSKRGPSLATWGSFGLERLHLNPGEGWQGMTVTATFLLGDNEKTMVADADGMVDVPPQALAEAGNGVIVFSGDMAGAQRITADIRYKVIDHSEVRGDVPEPTPDAFHQYIEQTNQYREEAAASAASAAASAQQAAASADGAAGSAEKAGEYADNAYASANVAALQATNAKNSAAAAADSAAAAAASAAEAAGSEASVAADAEAARQAASAAEASETAAASSASAAKTSETNAESSKTAAASSASAAKTSETNAASSKTAAANSATAAASSAGEAADSAAAAADSAAAAAASAAEAAGSEASVAADAEAARQAASAAEASETAAASSASAAKTSETNAESSKTAAASSASAAKTSETNAASSKTAAANSATAAASSAGEAADSAAAAADSAAAAAASAAAAAASAAEAEGITTYQHRKLGTEHHLIGKGPDGKAQMTADVDTGDTVVLHDCADVDGLVIEGKTTQAGTGDPSPENIRPISGVGMYDKCVVLDGSEAERWFAFRGVPGVFFHDFTPQVDNAKHIKTNSKKYNPSTDISKLKIGEFATQSPTNYTRFILRYDNLSTDPKDVKDYLSAHPLTVWYRSVDYAKSTGPFYTVVELSDDTYRAVGFELTQPLFDGDSLKVGGKSGFDKMVVLDGSKNFGTATTTSGNRRLTLSLYIPPSDVQFPSSSSIPGEIASSRYPTRSADDTYNSIVGIGIQGASDKAGDTFLFDPNLQTNEAAKAYFQSHPLIVFYKSVDYTEDKDIPVVLEKHTKGLKIVTGTEAITEDANGTTDGYDAVYSVPCLSPVRGSIDLLSSHYKGVAGISPASGNVGVRTESYSDSLIFEDASTLTSLEEAKSYFAVQHTAGTPVQVVYEFSAPVEYARLYDGTTLPAYIGTEDFGGALDGEPVSGKWLTFTQDGTQVNFKGGGGLSGSKLAAADAEPGDVRTGKKFYAGDKEVKTGTLPVHNVSIGSYIDFWTNSSNGQKYIDINKIPEGIYESTGAEYSPQVLAPAELFGNAADSQVLAGVTFTSQNGAKIPGTMPNQGAKTAALNAGGSYTIPQGWHNGSGKVTANSLASQTDANAADGDILTGKTAWVKGAKRTGTMPNQGAKTAALNAGGSYTIPAGYHNGSGKVTANSLASQTDANAAAGNILTGKTAWVKGAKITGTMANRGAPNQTLGIGGSYSLSAGYYSGGKISAKGSFGGSGSGNKNGGETDIHRDGNNIVAKGYTVSSASASISGKTVTVNVHAHFRLNNNGNVNVPNGDLSSVDYSFSFNIG